MSVLLIVAAVWAMSDSQDEYMSLSYYRVSSMETCLEQTGRYRALLKERGRWAQQYRYFEARCVSLEPFADAK